MIKVKFLHIFCISHYQYFNRCCHHACGVNSHVSEGLGGRVGSWVDCGRVGGYHTTRITINDPSHHHHTIHSPHHSLVTHHTTHSLLTTPLTHHTNDAEYYEGRPRREEDEEEEREVILTAGV